MKNQILRYLKVFPVVGITGPRQSGKSTVLKHLFKNEYTYVTFDDYRIFSGKNRAFISTSFSIFRSANVIKRIINLYGILSGTSLLGL